MAVLTKEQIYDADDCLMEEFDIPEWGGSVFIKVMKSVERDRLEELANKGELKGFPIGGWERNIISRTIVAS